MNRKSGLDKVYSSKLARRRNQGRLRRLTVQPPNTIDFSSNNYLSLTTNADISNAYIRRLLSSPSQLSLGSCGSRLLDGNSAAAEKLEHTIAAFHGAPAGLLFNSGFDANTGLFGSAPQPGDVIVYDELIHASVHDGMKLSRARRVPFAHNRVNDSVIAPGEPQCLDKVLQGLIQGHDGERLRKGDGANVFIAVESVYSMDGDVVPLQAVVDCVKERLPAGNGYIIVDEAHSSGWLGDRGRGLVCHLGLEDRVWARVHTFGKALGCSGAIVLCSFVTREYLINYARSLIYTTAMGYPTLASIQTVYEFLENGNLESLLTHLRSLIEYVHGLLSAICHRARPSPTIFRVNKDIPKSPVIPLFTSQARSLAEHCQQEGFMLRPIVFPTVPTGTDRVRLCLHAGNTNEQAFSLCKTIEKWVFQRSSELCPAPGSLKTRAQLQNTSKL